MVQSNHESPLKAEFSLAGGRRACKRFQAGGFDPRFLAWSWREPGGKECRQLLEAKSGHHLTANKEPGTSGLQCKESNSPNDEHELADGFFLRASDKNSVLWATGLQLSDRPSSRPSGTHLDRNLWNCLLMGLFQAAQFVVICYRTIENQYTGILNRLLKPHRSGRPPLNLLFMVFPIWLMTTGFFLARTPNLKVCLDSSLLVDPALIHQHILSALFSLSIQPWKVPHHPQCAVSPLCPGSSRVYYSHWEGGCSWAVTGSPPPQLWCPTPRGT